MRSRSSNRKLREREETMNRHERRKAAVLQGRLETITPERARELIDRGGGCCWSGCNAVFSGRPMPGGWRCLLVFWSGGPIDGIADIPGATWDRDGTLCPEHAAELERLLKPTGYAMFETRGTA